ncbi:acyl-CoA dehydrogenase family protein [Nocardia puris]|uniref:acyl-CoA dehydrogenase family protein n=1 Tax=Nocardia puris TaxID=208602 RepID=UPI002E2263F7
MTTTRSTPVAVPMVPLLGDPTATPTLAALHRVIVGEHADLHERARALASSVRDRPVDGVPYPQQASVGPGLLRAAFAGLGMTAGQVYADPELRGAVCDAAAVLAPRLMLSWTGHVALTVGAVRRLGNGSSYQRAMLADLDSGAATGVRVHTELAGTNTAPTLRTLAIWDPRRRGFWLHTTDPDARATDPGAAKFMANAFVPVKIATIAVRAIIDGRDAGVHLVALRLHTPDGGITSGVRITALGDKAHSPMDHAMLSFFGAFVPFDGLLVPGARVVDGTLVLPEDHSAHFAVGAGDFTDGRLDLGNASIAAARGALAALVSYAHQREVGGVRLIDRDSIDEDLATQLGPVYAATALGRRLRSLRAATMSEPSTSTTDFALLVMLAKPLLSDIALSAIMTVHDDTGAHAHLRANRIADLLGGVGSIRTAEGANRVLRVVAGSRADLRHARLPGAELSWPGADMLIAREDGIAADRTAGDLDRLDAAGPEAAAEMAAQATAIRLAAQAVALDLADTTDPTARQLLEDVLGEVTLTAILDHGQWHHEHGHLSQEDLSAFRTQRRAHRTRLAAHARLLTTAFAVPAIPRAPLFSANYLEEYP